MERKVYVLRTAMCRKEKARYDYFENYGVYSSKKLATEAMEKNYRINKGWDWRQDEYRPDIFDYRIYSTDGNECMHRFILEEHRLNKCW